MRPHLHFFCGAGLDYVRTPGWTRQCEHSCRAGHPGSGSGHAFLGRPEKPFALAAVASQAQHATCVNARAAGLEHSC